MPIPASYLDLFGSGYAGLGKKGVHRTDKDFAVSWVRNYGKGRVFVSTLGHRTEIWEHAQVQKMWLEAAKWVMHLTPAGEAAQFPAEKKETVAQVGEEVEHDAKPLLHYGCRVHRLQRPIPAAPHIDSEVNGKPHDARPTGEAIQNSHLERLGRGVTSVYCIVTKSPACIFFNCPQAA